MEEITFEIQETLRLFKRKIWLVLGIIVLVTGLGVAYSTTLDTMYRARVKVYVGKSNNVVTTYTEDEMKHYKSFMDTFKEIIVIDDFLNETLENNYINLTADQVKNNLTFISGANSPILEINYTSLDKEEARTVLKALSDEYEEQATSILEEAKVQVVDSIKIFSIVPSVQKVILVAFAIGIILAIGIVLTLDYLDDKIHRKETLEQLLPIPVIGQLPHYDAKENS